MISWWPVSKHCFILFADYLFVFFTFSWQKLPYFCILWLLCNWIYRISILRYSYCKVDLVHAEQIIIREWSLLGKLFERYKDNLFIWKRYNFEYCHRRYDYSRIKTFFFHIYSKFFFCFKYGLIARSDNSMKWEYKRKSDLNWNYVPYNKYMYWYQLKCEKYTMPNIMKWFFFQSCGSVINHYWFSWIASSFTITLISNELTLNVI